MKKSFFIYIISTLTLLASLLFSSCSGTATSGNENMASDNSDEPKIVVGFTQVGAESDWRAANTESMKSALSRKYGYEIIFEDAQQKQTNQITAVRSFIQQGVDYIVIAPVTENGWDTVLMEAKEAGIPVILVDRMVNVKDDSLFECWVGSDFELEASKVCEWLNRFTISEGISPEEINIVNIQGTIGASAQIGRTEGLRIAAKEHGWNLLGEVEGDFTKAKGYEATLEILNTYPEVNVIYCENDNEAFGAIEALEASGKVCGTNIKDGEIMILSFDGVKSDALDYLMEGKIACIGECNPLHGPRVRAIIDALAKGEKVEKLTYVDEEIFSTFSDTKTIFLNGNQYDICIMDEAKITERQELFNIGNYSNETSDAY